MRQLLLVVAAALVVVLLARWAVVHNQDKAERAAERQKVAAVNPADVKRIVVVRRDADDAQITFEKRSGKWWIVEPELYPASTYTVDALVTSVGDLKKERTFEASADAMAKDTYGLLRPQYEVQLYGDGVTRMVRLGEKNPAGEFWYAQTDTDTATTLHLIKSGIDNQMSKTVVDYRVREIFWDFPDSVTHMRVEYGRQITDFTRDLASQPASQATWYFSTSTLPATRPAEKTQVDAVLNGLRNLNANGFEPVANRDVSRRLTVWGAGHHVSVGFAAMGPEGFVAVVDGRPFDYTVPMHAVKPLFKRARKFEPDTSNPGAINEMVREKVEGLSNDQAEE